MKIYDFNTRAYNKIVELFKFRFYKQIKDTGIVFKEILSAENLVTGQKFFILMVHDQEKMHSISFVQLKVLILRLTKIAKIRLEKLQLQELELLRINDTEAYGEDNYFNDTEMTAIAICSIQELLNHFEKNKMKWDK